MRAGIRLPLTTHTALFASIRFSMSNTSEQAINFAILICRSFTDATHSIYSLFSYLL
jgi:hypothetical protein